ncbi:MAG: hypothetical protein WCD11_03735 [Solirubrobacteraceae bacterium]
MTHDVCFVTPPATPTDTATAARPPPAMQHAGGADMTVAVHRKQRTPDLSSKHKSSSLAGTAGLLLQA